jgi:hypothetical protein
VGGYLDNSTNDLQWGDPVDVSATSCGQVIVLNTGWWQNPAPNNPYRGSLVTWRSSQGQTLLSEGNYSGPAANAMAEGGSGGGYAYIGCVYDGVNDAGHITAVGGNFWRFPARP